MRKPATLARRDLRDAQPLAHQWLRDRYLFEPDLPASDFALVCVQCAVGCIVEEMLSPAPVRFQQPRALRRFLDVKLLQLLPERLRILAMAVKPPHNFVEHHYLRA